MPAIGIPVTSFSARIPDIIIAGEASLGTRRRTPAPVRGDRPAGGRAGIARAPADRPPPARLIRPPLDAPGGRPPHAEVPGGDPSVLRSRHRSRPRPGGQRGALLPAGAGTAGDVRRPPRARRPLGRRRGG